VLRIAAEFEDVPLRDADVLEQFPRGVGQQIAIGALGTDAATLRRHVFDRIVEGSVRIAAFEERDEVLAETAVGVRLYGAGHQDFLLLRNRRVFDV
jgi:hypothetical protein